MPLTLYERGKIWHYRGSIEGQRFRGTTGLSDKAAAQRFIIKKQAEILEEKQSGKKAKLSFAKAALLYRKAGKPVRFIDRMEDYWAETPVSEITGGKVKAAALELYPRATGSTKNRHVIVPTQAVINHAASLDLCPPLKVKRFKVETKVKTPATWEWVQSFMAHSSPHLGGLCAFMYLTGARVSEAADLRWADVNLIAGRAVIRQTKVGKERVAHLPPELVEAIKSIGGDREPDGKVFRYSSRHTIKPQWNKVIKRSGIAYLTFHSCRHGFATDLLHRGVDPITVAKLGGWADAQLVFNTYGHAMQDVTLSNLLTDTRADTKERHKTEKVNGIVRLKVIE